MLLLRFDRRSNTRLTPGLEFVELISIYKRLRAFESRISDEPEILVAVVVQA